jgi:molecular chaperone DnaK (HSP70)
MSSIGIDLGTTNTAAAVDGRVVPIGDEPRGRATLPSVVAYPPTGATIVGVAARRRRAIDPKNTISSAKRIIGRGWFARETGAFAGRYPFDLVRIGAGLPAFRTRAGVLTPTDIAAAVLRAVRSRLEKAGAKGGVTVGVPSGFGPAERAETAAAALAAGLGPVRIVDEPVATAWAYHQAAHAREGRAVVFDLGGGTFDLAVLDCRTEPFTVLAHGGDLYLGGDDLDHALAEWAAAETLRLHGWDLRADAEAFDRLVLECERAKIRLSFAPQTRIELTDVDPAAPLTAGALVLERTRLEALCTDLVRRTFGVCDEVLAQAGVRAREVEAVYLAGGTCQLPMIRAAVEQYFGRAPRCDFDPMEVVAIGASLVE